jgi:hypothetical protein
VSFELKDWSVQNRNSASFIWVQNLLLSLGVGRTLNEGFKKHIYNKKALESRLTFNCGWSITRSSL